GANTDEPADFSRCTTVAQTALRTDSGITTAGISVMRNTATPAKITTPGTAMTATTLPQARNVFRPANQSGVRTQAPTRQIRGINPNVHQTGMPRNRRSAQSRTNPSKLIADTKKAATDPDMRTAAKYPKEYVKST